MSSRSGISTRTGRRRPRGGGFTLVLASVFALAAGPAAAAAPAETAPSPGEYAGTSEQTHSGGHQDEETVERAFAFEVDDAGRIARVSGEFWWFCAMATPDSHGTVDFADSGFPATPVAVDAPFDVEWVNEDFRYGMTGTLRSDGTASGTIWASWRDLYCGPSQLNWSARADTPPPSPTPAPTPTSTPTPTPTSSPAPTPTPSETPAPSPGDFPAPADEALSADLEGGITAPAEAAEGQPIEIVFDQENRGSRAGLWLLSGHLSLGVHEVADDGVVRVTLPDGVAGEHRLAAVEADGSVIGWQQIVIAADDAPGVDRPGDVSPGGSQDDAPLVPTDRAAELPLLLGGVGLVAGVALLWIVRRRAA